LGYGIRGPRDVKAKMTETTTTAAAASSGVHIGRFIDRLDGQTREFRQQGTAVIRDVRRIVLDHLMLLSQLDIIQLARPVPLQPHLSILCRVSIDSATFARFSLFSVICATVSIIDDVTLFRRHYSNVITRPIPLFIAAERDTLETVRHYGRYLADAAVLLKEPFVLMVSVVNGIY
jgi:hypothetical protein